ncbi:hypothetical protein FXO37_31089 [Capsicum annuum]|nr:hypothetical protein FXO37_31089 [Capsicum annuum]
MLFGINLERADGLAPVWNHDVRFYLVNGSFRIPIAYFYFDPYFHPSEKSGGAWMGGVVSRNVWDKPSLMTFREVENVFHEFGHALQHMLTKQDEGLVAAIRGIEWDAMELPSQVMQNWCYHRYGDVFAMILEPFNLVAHLYCHCSSVYMYLALNCSHDVIGVVLSISPTISIWRKSNNETVPKRGITIADEMKKTVVVSLWNDLATNVGQELLDMADKSPVVAIKSLKVRLSRCLIVNSPQIDHSNKNASPTIEFINIICKALMPVATFVMVVICGTDKLRCDVFLNMFLGQYWCCNSLLWGNSLFPSSL